MKNYNKLVFEVSKEGRKAYSLPKCDVPELDAASVIPEAYLSSEEPKLPELSEVDVIRHFTNLSQKNFGLDGGFYPLGSCTMKYNPKINEDMCRIPGLTNVHPYQPEETVQGSLEIMYNLAQSLAEISGMDEVTLQPAAGAHGEYAGLLTIKEYHKKRGDLKRTKIIVPDSAHGTNPASAYVAGLEIVEIESNSQGGVDIENLKAVLNDEVAGFMLTNPSTLGLFEVNITEITKLIHEAGGLCYYDGANLNAIMGKTRPGDMGFDVMHFNLHKTFSTPHGGGGPGAGPIGVKAHLAEFLPVPVIAKKEDKFILDYDRPNSMGKIKNFYGNYGVCLRAYAYVKTMGASGLKEVSEAAVLNANYMMHKLKGEYKLPYDQVCKHEFVLDGLKGSELEVTTLDVAKRLLDYGYHPPTVYFPLIVHQSIMIEPTETEARETLDEFVDAMLKIAEEAKRDPQILKNAPQTTLVKRLDEVKAAKDLILKYQG